MNIVVIGLGSMGRRRIRLLQNIAMHDRIIGVDTNEIRVSTISEQYKITCYKSLAEADETIDIQVAFVCTSPISHHTIITECLTRGWHVFTEINLIADDYEQNIRLAREKQLVLFLSSTPIYRAEMKTITRQLQDRELPVNYIYHVGQYLPDWHPWEDFTQFFVGDKRTNGCREIFAIELPWMIKAFGEVMDIHVIHNRITKLPIDYDDNYLVQLLHADGTSGVLCVDVACRQAVRHLEIYNEQIFLEWQGTPETLRSKNLVTGEMEQIATTTDYVREANYSEFVNEYAYACEIQEFFEVLQTGKAMQYSMEEDNGVLKLIDKIEQIQ